MKPHASTRRDLVYFLAGPVALSLAAALLFQLRPWPVPLPSQAAILGWAWMVPMLAAGELGVFLAPRVGCPSAPPLSEASRWGLLLAVSCGVGFACGAEGLVYSNWPPVARQLDILARQSGYSTILTWVNVGLPWSIPHYVSASVVLECAFRIAPIPILTWLISNLLLKGRWQGGTFWTVGTLAAAQEPLLYLLGLVHTALAPITAAFVALNTFQAFAINMLEVAGLRRFGWPATIAFRVSFYAAARVFLPYLLSPHSVSYPGPH